MEPTNKNIKKILVKMIDTYKDWHEYLSFAPTYEGPYVVKKAFLGGALILTLIGMTSICPPILTPSYSTLHEGAS